MHNNTQTWEHRLPRLYKNEILENEEFMFFHVLDTTSLNIWLWIRIRRIGVPKRTHN